MNKALVKNLKDSYNLLWPSFFAVTSFLFAGLLSHVFAGLLSYADRFLYVKGEDFFYLVLISVLILIFLHWIFFVIQIYVVVERYFFIKKDKLFLISYFLFLIFYFLFFIFYLLFFIFDPSNIQNNTTYALIAMYQTFGLLFLLNFSYKVFSKNRQFITKYILIVLAIISDFVLRYVFNSILYFNLDSFYYQGNLFLIPLIMAIIQLIKENIDIMKEK